VRKESAIRRRTVAAPEVGEDWSPTPAPGADQAAMARVAAGQVRAALHRLPVEQRQALALAYFGGHTQRENRSPDWCPAGNGEVPHVHRGTAAAITADRSVGTGHPGHRSSQGKGDQPVNNQHGVACCPHREWRSGGRCMPCDPTKSPRSPHTCPIAQHAPGPPQRSGSRCHARPFLQEAIPHAELEHRVLSVATAERGTTAVARA
jgi:hypothetical protein